MDKTLAEQVQATLEVLEMARAKARDVSHAMRKRKVSFGLDYSHIDEDIAQVIGKVRYVKLLAERRDQFEARAAKNAETDPIAEAE